MIVVNTRRTVFKLQVVHELTQRLQVAIAERQPLHFLLAFEIDRDGQELVRAGWVAELAGVAREVVRNDADLGELVRDRQKLVPRFLGALRFMQAVGLIDPAGRIVRGNTDEPAGNFQGRVPIILGGFDTPENFEYVRMFAAGLRDFRPFEFRFTGVPQLEPADGSVQTVVIRGFQFLHSFNPYTDSADLAKEFSHAAAAIAVPSERAEAPRLPRTGKTK